MDLDNDPITSELLQKFSCLNTNDRDVLVEQFKLLLGDKCLDSTAQFWLDMNNWNLQAAVCSYFDYESTSPNSQMLLKLPSVQIAIPENQMTDIMVYLPNSQFTYTCTVTNSGEEIWPPGCTLRFTSGQQLSKDERQPLPQLYPGETVNVVLPLVSPEKAGLYCSQWRFSTLTGQFFGETVFIIVNVLDDTFNRITKQLSAAHIVDDSNQQLLQEQQQLNPFSSSNNEQSKCDMFTADKLIINNNNNQNHNNTAVTAMINLIDNNKLITGNNIVEQQRQQQQLQQVPDNQQQQHHIIHSNYSLSSSSNENIEADEDDDSLMTS